MLAQGPLEHWTVLFVDYEGKGWCIGSEMDTDVPDTLPEGWVKLPDPPAGSPNDRRGDA